MNVQQQAWTVLSPRTLIYAPCPREAIWIWCVWISQAEAIIVNMIFTAQMLSTHTFYVKPLHFHQISSMLKHGMRKVSAHILDIVLLAGVASREAEGSGQ